MKFQQNTEAKRTEQQNRALHLWYKLLAEELNIAGLDMRKALKPEIDILWSDKAVKEYLWRPIQEAMFQKKSTTELLKQEEIDGIYETICRHLGKLGFTCPEFPSVESKD